MKSFKSKSGVFSRINAVFRTLPNIYDGNFCNKRQKQPSRGVIRKKCSENMQQIYRRTPGNLQHIFRTPFPKNTSTDASEMLTTRTS